MWTAWCKAILALVVVASAQADVQVAPMPTAQRFFASLRPDIVLDGELSEWRFDAPGSEVRVSIANSRQHPGPVESDADASARVRLAWNGDKLFLAAKVRDQHLVSQQTVKSNPWDCDSLMINLTTFGGTRGNPRYQQKKTNDRAREPFFGYSYRTADVPERKWSENSTYLVKPTQQGYDIEGVISLSDIGYDVRPGDRIKMSFILSDRDEDGDLTQLLCGMPDDSTPSDVATNYWLDLRFRDQRPYAGELTPVQDKIASGKSLELTGQVDVLDRDVELIGLRVRDGNGQIVLEQKASGKLQVGQRYGVSAKVALGALPPGDYHIAMVFQDNGRESNGGVHGSFQIVQRVESSDTVVGNMPDRFLTPDGYRYINFSSKREYRPMTLTRDDYLKVVQRVQDHWKERLYDKGRQADTGIYGVNYAVPEYALYKATGDKQRLQTVLGLVWHMHEAHKKNQPSVIWTAQYRLVQMLLADPDVPEADKVWLREVFPRIIETVWAKFKPTEWGAFNRAMLWGILCDYAVKELPNSPNVPRWKQYADLEWDSWWPYRDHDENASDYNSWSLLDMLTWARYRDPSALRDPGLIALIERNMLQVTPSGGMPGYGDASPWHASSFWWIPMFELMATETRDGRFKWAARRLLEYNIRQIDDLMSYHAIFDGASYNCALAWLWADESVPEAVPDMRSRVLSRKRVLPVDEDMRSKLLRDHGITGLFFHLTQEKQFDKLLLRAGNDPFAPAAMVELCSTAGHHMTTVPNINYFMQQRSVLLTDQGYFDKGPEFHNVIYIEDLSGITPSGESESVTVPEFKVGARATWASVNVDWYKGWPVTNQRQVLFTHEGPMLVRDLVTFRTPFVAQVRQQWHTRNIGPGNGANYVNGHIPAMLHSGLGLGGAATRWWNPSWDLLIYFPARGDLEFELTDRSPQTPWQTVPLRFSQRWRGMQEPDRPMHFTTLLWPHKPEFDGNKYGNAITVLADSLETTAIQIELSDKQRMVLGVNQRGAARTFGELTTDARAFVLELAMDNGRAVPTRIYAVDAKTVRLGDRSILQSEQAQDVDKGL